MSKSTLKEALANSPQYRIRMFKSDFLEQFSYVHPLTPFIIFIPVTLVSLYYAFAAYHMNFVSVLAYFILGLGFWTIMEYVLHRWVFHPPMTNEFFRKVYFYIHGIHHDALMDASRLVMPPAVSIPLAIGLFYAFKAMFPFAFLAVFAGLIVGYMIYDFLHFATHFYSFPYQWFKIIKKNHMRHHHADPKKNFGFTSPLWDIVFGTYLSTDKK